MYVTWKMKDCLIAWQSPNFITRLVTGKSRTWTMKRGCHGEVSGFQTIRTYRDGLEKSRDKSATSKGLRRSNGIWERARHDTTNGLWHIADTSRGETVKSPTSRVLSQGCQGLVADVTRKLA